MSMISWFNGGQSHSNWDEIVESFIETNFEGFVVCELKFEHPTIDFFIKILVDCAYTISKANFDDIHVVINVTIKI